MDMQKERGNLNSFTETIDLNQGSCPNNNTTEYSESWNNLLNPVDNRLSNYMFASRDGLNRDMNGSDSFPQRSISWECGESSSQTNNLLNCHNDSEKRLGWSSLTSACSSTNPGEFSNLGESSNVLHNQPNFGSMALVSSNEHLRESNGHIEFGASPSNPQQVSGTSETGIFPTLYASSSEAGSSRGSSSKVMESNDESGPFLGSRWGSSCKRKALEGTSRQFYHGRSSSFNKPADSFMQHIDGDCSTAPLNLSSSSAPQNLSPIYHPNLRGEIGVRRVQPTIPPSSSTSRVGQIPAPNFRTNLEQHQSNLTEPPRSNTARYSSVYVGYPLSSPSSGTFSSGLRPTPVSLHGNPTSIRNNSHSMNLNEDRGFPSPPWNRSVPRGANSPSFMLFEESSGEREEANIRNSPRNYTDYPVIVQTPEAINNFRDQIDWSFSPGTSSVSSRNHSSSSQIGSGSGGWGFSGAFPRYHQSQSSQNHQRLREATPWFPLPTIESDSGIQRNRFPHFPPASTSMEDDINGRRALSAVERRHRLIHPLLNAMRRAAHLQAEDYMLIDPFINGFAELHDRYRDMRLDVDNMSYEELLALEDQIGNVNTGLNEEKISASMKQTMYKAALFSVNMEPCCICQEAYIKGDDIGILDCGHEFHTHCIKQWLLLKNLCPICKMTALAT